MKRYPILFLLLFLLLLFLFGCGSPSQDIGGGQSSQSQEAAPSPEAPVALAENPASSQQELTSQQGESSLPEESGQEDIFAVYGDGKLIAAWSTDAEGNSYSISKERAEKLISSEIVEKMKSCKAFYAPYLYRCMGNTEALYMDTSNGVAYKTDWKVYYGINFSDLPNPCPIPFVFALGWVSPDSSENTITKYAPEIPPCAAGGMLKYTSGWGVYTTNHWFRLENDPPDWSDGGIDPCMGGCNIWLNQISLLSQRDVNKLSLGQWQIPTYAGETGACSTFWVRQLVEENLSSEPAPSGGYIIKGDVVVLPDRPQPPADLNWTLKITDSHQNVVFTKEGTGNTVNVTWDGKVSGQAVDSALYSFNIHVDAPQEKTYADAQGQFPGNPTIEVWTTEENPPKRIATSDPEADQTTLLNQVFLPARQGNNVKIVVKDPPTSGSTYQVEINTTKTKQPLTLTLAKGSKNEYTGSLDLGSPWIVNNPRGHQTTFTSVDTTDRADSNAFINQMKSTSTIPAYALQRLQMGCAWAGANPLDPLKFEEIEPSLSAVQAAGFEEVIVSFPDDKPDVKARFRVKNEADVFYYSGHASYPWNYLEIYDHTVFGLNYKDNPCPGPDPAVAHERPVNLTSADWGGNLKTVIFACCAVLDINDYNGGAHKKYSSEELNLHLQEYAPGKKWDALRKGDMVLLGYNWYSPLGRTTIDTQVINKYFEYLTLGRRYSQPEAWIWTNISMFDIFADNACAIDKDAYYFIKYDIVKKTGKHENRTLYKIPRPWPTTWGEASKKAIPFGDLP